MLQKRRRTRQRVNTGPCSFCEAKTDPDYKEAEVLRKFLTDRGKIVGRMRTGICQKHQRALANAIKRARHLALLPFVGR